LKLKHILVISYIFEFIGAVFLGSHVTASVHFLVNILSVVNGGRSGTDCLFENDVKYTKKQYRELREWFHKLVNRYKHIVVVDDSVLQPNNSYQIYNKNWLIKISLIKCIV
jgi:hypothetical protein